MEFVSEMVVSRMLSGGSLALERLPSAWSLHRCFQVCATSSERAGPMSLIGPQPGWIFGEHHARNLAAGELVGFGSYLWRLKPHRFQEQDRSLALARLRLTWNRFTAYSLLREQRESSSYLCASLSARGDRRPCLVLGFATQSNQVARDASGICIIVLSTTTALYAVQLPWARQHRYSWKD